MASSVISNSHHIDFESVFGLDDAGMVQMFETLITTGLKEFLGFPAVFYEAALTEFFTNSSVREDGMVVSTIGGTAIEIFQEMFAAAFDLPTEGLIDLTDVPKNFVFYARSLFSDSKEQEKGYTIQICVPLRNVPGLELGESKAFPVPSVLNEKTVRRYVSINERIGVEEVTDAPRAKKTSVKKTVSKNRKATGDAGVGQVVKKKRTTKGKPVAAKRISVEKQVDDCSTAEPPVEERATGVQGRSTDVPVSEDPPAADPDDIIEQILIQLDTASAKKDDYTETWFDRAFDDEFASTEQEKQDSEEQIIFDVAKTVSAAEITKIRLGESINIPGVQEHDLCYASLPRISVHDKGKEPLVEDEPIKGNPARETVELICGDVEFLVGLRDQVMVDVVEFFHSFSLNKLPDYAILKTLKEKKKLMLAWAEADSLEMAVKRKEYILAKYREMLLRKFLESHQKYLVPGQPWTATASQIIDLLSAAHSKSLEVLVTQQRENGLPIEQPCSSTYLDTSIEGQTQDDIQLLRLNELKKSVMAHDIKADTDSLDVRNKFNAIDLMPILLDGQIAAIRNVLLEFQSKIAADILSLATQIGDIVDYIRDGDVKKGEIGSSSRRPPPVRVERRPLPTPANQGDDILSRLRTVEHSLQASLGHQNDYLRRLIESARQEGQTQDDIQLLRLNELKKSVMAHDIKADTDSLDVRNKFNAIDAKFLLLDGQIAAIRNDQLEFQSKISADILSLSTQIGDIADYIRGGDAKKGEIGSSSHRPPPVRVERRPLPTQANQGESSTGHGRVLNVEEAAEMVREADRQSDRREREKEREKSLRRLRRRGH
ncbi:hypothetical protein F511_32777 [Dorcoceras hygrometricum]|uniref:Dystroglycan-like n=1 Tax=Dorcoceras hygrometricum TaxID=472368 RepID=A0A2Z7BWN6_9LAMI|nr:hypothetical protein F511_32777 [Dorcoceras hygrometricum]